MAGTARVLARRARRLLPALVVLLMVLSVVAGLIARDAVPTLRADIPAALGFVANWQLLFHHDSYFEAVGRPPLLLHLWSLGVEEQFYLVWPLVVLGAVHMCRRPVRALCWIAGTGSVCSAALMAALFVAGHDPSAVYYDTFTHSAGLMIGAALAAATYRRRLAPVRYGAGPRAVIGSIALAGLVVLMVLLGSDGTFTYRGGIFLASALTGLVILVAVRPGPVGRLLSAKPLRYLGARSYSLYLWHWPIICLTRPDIDVRLSGTPLLVLRLALVLLAGEASYKMVEQPFRTGQAQAALHSLSGAGRKAAVGSLGLGGGVALVVLAVCNPPALPAALAAGSTPAARAVLSPVTSASPLGTLPRPALSAPPRKVPRARPNTTRASVKVADVAATRTTVTANPVTKTTVTTPRPRATSTVRVASTTTTARAASTTTTARAASTTTTAPVASTTTTARVASTTTLPAPRTVATRPAPNPKVTSASSRTKPLSTTSVPATTPVPATTSAVVRTSVPTPVLRVHILPAATSAVARTSVPTPVLRVHISPAPTSPTATSPTATSTTATGPRTTRPATTVASDVTGTSAAPPSTTSLVTTPVKSPPTTTAPTTTSRTARLHPTTTTTTAPRPRLGHDYLAVGDSVLLASAQALEQRLNGDVTVDAVVGRQVWNGISRLAEYRAAGDLTGLKAVIIDLGTNGPMTPGDVAQLRALTAGVPLLVLVNVRVPLPWQGESNASLAAAQGLPRVVVVDWYNASAAPGLLWPDGIHPDPKGQVIYANLVAAALSR